jgi:uncharacterized protein DUF1566
MKNKFIIATLLASSLLFGGCTEDLPIVIEGTDLNVTIPENPEMGQVLGKINISITNADKSSVILDDGELSGYISFDENTGEVKVTNPAIFDFETKEIYKAKILVDASNRNYTTGEIISIVITLTNVIEATDIPAIMVENFEVTIDENPTMGQSLGIIDASVTSASRLKFYLPTPSTALANYISLNETTGEVLITNPSFFDYELWTTNNVLATLEAYNDSNGFASASFTITINLIDVLESVQDRLDAGQTPLEIYNSDNSLLSDLYGATYAGGLIFYFNTTDGTGLVAAESDLSSTLPWDPNAPAGGFLQTNETLTAIGTGAANTAGIIADLGDGSYAAKACADLTLNEFSDWFLPSIDELQDIWENLHNVGLGNLTNGFYWSSSETENSGNQAWHADFTNPDVFFSTGAFKDDQDNVRAVRAF